MLVANSIGHPSQFIICVLILLKEISHDVVASPGSLRNLTALPPEPMSSRLLQVRASCWLRDARLVSPGSHDGRVAGSPVALSP